MGRYRLRPEAAADLEGIGDHIAGDSPARAAAFVRELRAACGRSAQTPGMGAPRDELRPGLRMFPVRGYLIFYQAADRGIEIVRVLNGARDVRSPL